MTATVETESPVRSGRITKRTAFRLGLVAVFVLAVAIPIAHISITYRLSPLFVGQTLARQGVASAIRAATILYEPDTKLATVHPPPHTELDSAFTGYQRMEEIIQTSGIRVREARNRTIIKSRFPFSYQPFEEPGLAELRKEYKLDEVAAGAKNELDVLIMLRNWARSRFQRHDYQPFMQNFDALTVLRNNIHNEKNEPWQPGRQFRPCHFFPLFYSQILLSMGYQPRLVRISHLEDRGYSGHGMVEVWSNQFDKWIAMDPDLNLHYEKDGVPLNLLDIHNERYAKTPTRVRMVRGIQTSGDAATVREFSVEEMIEYHSYIQILDMRNDWLTNHYFRGHPKRSDGASLFWIDERMPAVFNMKPKTSNVTDFYWTLNQTEIWAQREHSENKKMRLAFRTFTPNFKHFEVIKDGTERIVTDKDRFEWLLHKGENRIEVRSVNKFGVPGIVSWVKLTVD
jgi:hypothetical protein